MNYKKSFLTLTAVAAALPALAAEFALSDTVKGNASVTLTAGSMFRMDAPNPGDYAYIPSQAQGTAGNVPAGQLYGQTGGSDLNFKQGQAVSTVAKAFGEFSVKGQNLGFLVNGDAWHDFALGHDTAMYGNYPNGYTPGAPLSDAGFVQAAKFNGLMARDVYLFGNYQVGGGNDLSFKFGQQVMDWGGAKLLVGSIVSAASPMDYAALVRPGVLAQETKVSEGMLSVKLAHGKAWGVEGFVPYEARHSVLPGCGTFFDVTSFMPDGCNLAGVLSTAVAPATPGLFPTASTVNMLTEQSVLNSGLYLHRSADVAGNNRGQFGLSGHMVFEPIQTDVTAYMMNTTSSMPFLRVYLENTGSAANGGFFNNTNPAFGALPFTALPAATQAAYAQFALLAAEVGRLNVTDVTKLTVNVPGKGAVPLAKFLAGGVPAATANPDTYATVYPSNIQTFGLSFDTKLSQAFSTYGEVAYRPNQPIGDNPADLVWAFVTRDPNALLAQQKGVLNIPAGGYYDGFDRFGVVNASWGLTAKFANMFGAAAGSVTGEFGISHINALPNVNVMRYGRPLAYATAGWGNYTGTKLFPYSTTPGVIGNSANSNNGQCAAGAPAAQPGSNIPWNIAPKTCTNDGFITATSTGFRLRAMAVYADVFGVKLTPTLLLADDFSGYSYDGVFSAGRISVSPQLKAEWNKHYYAEVRYTHFGGGNYNLLADRSNATIVLGAKF